MKALVAAVGSVVLLAAATIAPFAPAAPRDAALVCGAVGGAFGFDRHLPFVGFVLGCCVGLAVRADPVGASEAPDLACVRVP
jgi:hypothetical protein